MKMKLDDPQDHITKEDIGWKLGRGDAVRVITECKRLDVAGYEILAKVKGERDLAPYAQAIDFEAKIRSLKSWEAPGGPLTATVPDWFTKGRMDDTIFLSFPENPPDNGLDYQVNGGSDGEPWPLGQIKEIEAGAVVTHTTPRPAEAETDQHTLADFEGGVLE